MERLEQVRITLSRRDGDGEGHQLNPPAHGFVRRAHSRLVVARDDELERRLVLEEVLPHEARPDRFAAGRGFEPVSAQNLPSSVSTTLTMPAPCSPASSVEWRSVCDDMKVSKGAVMA